MGIDRNNGKVLINASVCRNKAVSNKKENKMIFFLFIINSFEKWHLYIV